MTDPTKPEAVLIAVSDWRMVIAAFVIGAIIVIAAVEILHRSLPEQD